MRNATLTAFTRKVVIWLVTLAIILPAAQANEPLNVILIDVCSMRPDHLSMNGYGQSPPLNSTLLPKGPPRLTTLGRNRVSFEKNLPAVNKFVSSQSGRGIGWTRLL